jgi:peptidoglycan/LPS O-acetylase OafA/YrhL
MVVWHHAHPGFAALPLTRNGFLGVDLFFVLSGFLITALLMHERETTGGISLRNFYIRRSLRIFPLYYLVLLALLAYMLVRGPSAGQYYAYLAELPYHATYTSNWIEKSTMMSITWSLSTEEQFYLVWPLLFVVLGAAALVFLVPFLFLNQAVNFGYLHEFLAVAGLEYDRLEILQCTFTPLILGVLVAYLFSAQGVRRFLARNAAVPAVTAALGVAALLAANLPGDLAGWPRLAFQACSAAVILLLAVRSDGYLQRTLEVRPLRYLGKISYGIYLLHMFAIDVSRRALDMLHANRPELLFLVSFVVAIAVAGLSYRYFERPILRLKDRFR